ncbi:MAG: putative membrane protein [Marivirga sp.]|jgi:uncharacterized membrane protein
MISIEKYPFQIHDSEAERASNSYLMSLVAIVAGLPLPILNLFATFIFYLANRKSTAFVRWHCTQALYSQLSLVIVNTAAFWWTISIITDSAMLSNYYIAYLIVAILFNILEFIATVYTAIQTRKGMHVRWWLYGDLADQVIHKEKI